MDGTKPVVLFDGVCNLCNSSVRFLLAYNRKENLYFASLQSDFAKQLLSKHGQELRFDTVVFVENSRVFRKSRAVCEIAKHLIYPWKVIYYFKYIPQTITDWLYDLIANNRYRIFGRKKQCMIPKPEWQTRFYE